VIINTSNDYLEVNFLVYKRREQGTGNREQGTGDREQGTGNREQIRNKSC
jgi:hypothetical protein